METVEEAMRMWVSVVSVPRRGHDPASTGSAVATSWPSLEYVFGPVHDRPPQRAPADDAWPRMAPAPIDPMTMMWDAEHEPAKPSWDCQRCGDRWPCEPARDHMVMYLGRIALAVHMADCLYEAAGDLRNLPPGQLFQRFVKWTRVL